MANVAGAGGSLNTQVRSRVGKRGNEYTSRGRRPTFTLFPLFLLLALFRLLSQWHSRTKGICYIPAMIKGKVAVVTGGATGIGKATALELGRQGVRIAICGRRQDVLEQASSELASEGIEVCASSCDISDQAQVKTFFETVAERFSRVDILVNNAGQSGVTKVSQPDLQRWDAIIRANVDSLYYCTAAVVPLMPDGGRIISISSILGKFGVPGYAAYCTSKHAVVGFTKSVALELAPRRITVNALCPGWVETDMAREGMEIGARALRASYDEFRKQALAAVPLQEMIEPGEVAEFIAFLVGSGAKNITGQSINICGGQVMH